MNRCYLCEFKSNKKSDPKCVGVTILSVTCVALILFFYYFILFVYKIKKAGEKLRENTR